MKWFGRDPAVLMTQLNGVLLALILLTNWDDEMQAAVGGVVTAVTAAVIAFAVRKDGQLAVLVGVARTVVALAVILGVNWDVGYQILLLAAFETVAGLFIRDRVEAPVDELGARRARTGPQGVRGAA